MKLHVISGGQTGVDIAALRAAKSVGFTTGGHIPKGFRTLDGDKPEYGKLYGLVETWSTSYLQRTELNVKNSDATIQIAEDFGSRGELSTRNYIFKHRKPSKAIQVTRTGPRIVVLESLSSEILSMSHWIVASKINVLNVAGNSEFTAPGIEAFAMSFLKALFTVVRDGVMARGE